MRSVQPWADKLHMLQRTHPVFDYNVDPCGAVHITIGDGGNSEGLSFLASNKMDLRELLPPCMPCCPSLNVLQWSHVSMRFFQMQRVYALLPDAASQETCCNHSFCQNANGLQMHTAMSKQAKPACIA